MAHETNPFFDQRTELREEIALQVDLGVVKGVTKDISEHGCRILVHGYYTPPKQPFNFSIKMDSQNLVLERRCYGKIVHFRDKPQSIELGISIIESDIFVIN